MMGALPVGWQYVLRNYRECVQDIRNKVDTARSVATVAANSAQEYAKEAAEYEKPDHGSRCSEAERCDAGGVRQDHRLLRWSR